jgi:adenylosuccinate synthase
LAVTKLDVLDGLDSIPLCTGYRAADIDGGGELSQFPADLALLERCEPVYEELPGWCTSTGETRSWGDLPPQARLYLERIETLVGVPITRVSVGQARRQILER